MHECMRKGRVSQNDARARHRSQRLNHAEGGTANAPETLVVSNHEDAFHDIHMCSPEPYSS